MIGLFAAAVFAAIIYAGSNAPQAVYRRATRFLFVWYLIVALFMALPLLGLVAFDTIASSVLVGPLAALVAGGIATTVIVAIVALLSFFRVVGAYLLMTALAESGTAYVWHTPRLVAGTLFVLLGLLVF